MLVIVLDYKTKYLSWLGVRLLRLVISRSLVQFPVRALWSVIGKTLYAASCSGISLGGLKWFPCVGLLGKEGCVIISLDTRL